MAHETSYAKYQVYFFLYLAVICELLIIIVERDDAEAGWLQEKHRLESLTRNVVIELVKNNPVSTVTGSTEMRTGEVRTFTFGVMGLGSMDNVISGPSIQVRHNGITTGILQYPRDIAQASPADGDSIRSYSFTWQAPAPGQYEFRGMTQTNRISFVRDSMKVGPLVFPLEMIRGILGYVPAVDSSLTASMIVNVVSTAEQLAVSSPRTVMTAAGFPVDVSLHVQGTEAGKVRIVAEDGTVAIHDGTHIWTGSYPSAGSHNVRISASDNRGEGAKSSASGSFTIETKDPVLRHPLPEKVYPNETTEIDIAVAGLESMGDYSWVVLENGRDIARGTHPKLSCKPSATGQLVIQARYQGRVYPVAGGASSNFTIPIVSPPYRLYGATFNRNGDYPITQRFQFRAARFGRSRNEYAVAVPAADIDVDVVDEDGNDLLADDPDISVTGTFTVVTFQLRGRVASEGTGAVITIRAGDRQETVPIVLTRE